MDDVGVWVWMKQQLRNASSSGAEQVIEGAYDGFISYSHAADRALAKSLQRVLHRLGRRWYRPSALRMFRDDTTLAASPDLWASIQHALLASRTFVLLASPESAASPWVGREVELWRRERSRDRFLIVLTDGELVWDGQAGDFDWQQTTALPQQLRSWFDTAPLWVDLRGNRARIQRREFRIKAAAVAAAIHGVPKDELLSEDVQQQRRLITVLSGLLVLALIAGAVAVWQRNTAVAQRDRADQQARIALSRALAAESEVHAQADPQLAAQVAIAAYSATATSEASSALLRELDRNRHVLAYVRRGTDQFSTQRAASAPTPTHVALSGNGSLLAYAHLNESAVTLWDPRERREVAKLRTDPPPGQTTHIAGPTHGLAFSADGRLLAADDGVRLQLWDVPSRRLVRTLDHAGGGYQLALSPDGRWLARAGDSRRGEPPVRVWHADTGEEMVIPASLDAELASNVLAFDADGDRLYAEYPNGIRVFDFNAATWTDSVPLLASRPLPFALATNSSRLAVAADEAVELWDPAVPRKLAAYPLPGTKDIMAVGISADARTVVVGDNTGRVVAVDTISRQTTELSRHRTTIADLAVTPNGDTVASVSDNGDIVLSAPFNDNRMFASAGPPEYGTNQHGINLGMVTAAALGPRGDRAILGRLGGTEVWELPGLRLLARLPVTVHPGDADVAISPDEATLAVLSGGQLTLADAQSANVLTRLALKAPTPPPLESSQGVHFLPDGRRVLVDTDGGPRVIDIQNGTPEQQLPVEDGGGGFATNTDGSLVAVMTQLRAPQAGGTTIEVWRWQDSRYERVGRVHESALARGVAVSEDGARLALVDIDGRVVIMDVVAPHQHRTFRVPGVGAHGRIGFTPDGATLVQADAKLGGIALWDVLSGRLLGTWLSEREPRNDNTVDEAVLDMGADGKALADRRDGTVVLWRVDVGAALHTLCSAAGELPGDDRTRYLQDIDLPLICGR